MTTSKASHPWTQFPMGPNVRRLVGLDDNEYRGLTGPAPTVDEREAFGAFVSGAITAVEIESSDALLDLMEELTAMDYAPQAIRLADLNPHLVSDTDSDALTTLGTACLLTGNFGRAEICFRDSHALDPAEPVNYVNMTQLLYADKRFGEALQWCIGGLEVAVNHHKLWEYLVSLFARTNKDTAADQLRARAESLDSWAGLSLACEMQLPGDAGLKAEVLGKLYEDGERDPEFLTEYTAALGGAGSYERIPLIVLQAERFASGSLPWQLYAHSLQANIARGLADHAEADLRKLQSLKTAPDNIIEGLSQVIKETAPAHGETFN